MQAQPGEATGHLLAASLSPNTNSRSPQRTVHSHPLSTYPRALLSGPPTQPQAVARHLPLPAAVQDQLPPAVRRVRHNRIEAQAGAPWRRVDIRCHHFEPQPRGASGACRARCGRWTCWRRPRHFSCREGGRAAVWGGEEHGDVGVGPHRERLRGIHTSMARTMRDQGRGGLRRSNGWERDPGGNSGDPGSNTSRPIATGSNTSRPIATGPSHRKISAPFTTHHLSAYHLDASPTHAVSPPSAAPHHSAGRQILAGRMHRARHPNPQALSDAKAAQMLAPPQKGSRHSVCRRTFACSRQQRCNGLRWAATATEYLPFPLHATACGTEAHVADCPLCTA